LMKSCSSTNKLSLSEQDIRALRQTAGAEPTDHPGAPNIRFCGLHPAEIE
jgi:hypothetical protein